jgi:hypothetical protein
VLLIGYNDCTHSWRLILSLRVIDVDSRYSYE